MSEIEEKMASRELWLKEFGLEAYQLPCDSVDRTEYAVPNLRGNQKKQFAYFQIVISDRNLFQVTPLVFDGEPNEAGEGGKVFVPMNKFVGNMEGLRHRVHELVDRTFNAVEKDRG